jgi:hypothetical protein
MEQEKISNLKSDILETFDKYKARSPDLLQKIAENDMYLSYFSYIYFLVENLKI